MAESKIAATKVLSREVRYQQGQSLRDKVPLDSHSYWSPPKNRADPIDLLMERDKGRIQRLLPIKYGRMSESSFGFLRGSAVIMASDLANTSASGIETMLCGDAHLNNFGIFATPERKLVFDINDFDECYPGPWEWDLKRLVTSAIVAGREKGLNDTYNYKIAKQIVRTYRETLYEFTKMSTLDVWYYHVDEHELLNMFMNSKKSAKVTTKAVRKARARTQEQTLEKLTEPVYGRRQFINNPPLLIRLDEIVSTDILTDDEKNRITEKNLEAAWFDYLSSLPEDRQNLLSRFRIADGALRVVGVGSVGTRCAIMLLKGGGDNDMLILQQKEAGPSALERYLPHRKFSSQAQRVVIGQRLLQATSDIFLGWSHGLGSELQYYWRQLKDMKGSIDVSVLDMEGFASYMITCSCCLARAHARAGDAAKISGYLDQGSPFDNAIAKFAMAYADQNNRDYQALLDAIDSGRIEAQTGI
jgi:uncharacterized protein (DUF2252 family)